MPPQAAEEVLELDEVELRLHASFTAKEEDDKEGDGGVTVVASIVVVVVVKAVNI